MKKKLILVTHKGASSTVEAIGFTGGACQAATAAIEAALGQTQTRQDKPELWQAETKVEQKLNVEG